MELNKAIFSIRAKKQDLYISAFKHKIVFGLVKEEIYQEDKFFQFDFSIYHKIYIGFLPIIKFLCGESNENNGIFLKNDDFSYKWSITKDLSNDFTTVNLKSGNFTLTFSLEELNDLVYLISEMCLISLGLSFENLTIFENLSILDINLLLSFQNKKKLKDQIRSLANNELSEMQLHFACELGHYNLDVIIAVHKLRSFFNNQKFSPLVNINEIINFEKESAENEPSNENIS